MLPDRVADALARAEHAGFALSCDRAVGELLAALAASVPSGGRVLELGTGCGVGLAWIAHGLDGRTDVEVVSVEHDHDTAECARRGDWPRNVAIVEDDAIAVLSTLGEFDLVFADSEAGKWERLDLTLAAVRVGGWVIVDDMTPERWESERHHAKTLEVRSYLLEHPAFNAVELMHGTGVILGTRRTLAPAVEVVVRFVERVNRGDVDGLAELMTDDHTLQVLDEPPLVGKAVNVDAWRGYASSFPDYVIHPKELAEQDGEVVVRGFTTGSHLGLPDAEERAIDVIWTARVEGTRLISWRVESA